MKVSLTSKKWIAVFCLGLSFLMLLFPWITISINVFGTKYTIPETFEAFGDILGISGLSSSEIRTGVCRELVELTDEMADENIHVDVERAMKMFDLVFGSSLTPIDTVRICSFANDVLGELNNFITKEKHNFTGSDIIIMSAITSAANKVAIITAALWILAIVTIGAFAFSAISLIRESKYGALPYLCVSILLLIAFVVTTSIANNGIAQIVKTFSNELPSFLRNLGIGSGDYSVFHFSIAGVFNVLFALSALLLTVLNGKAVPFSGKLPSKEDIAETLEKGKGKIIGGISTAVASLPRKWTCSCGAQMEPSASYCTACGKKRAERQRCAACGYILNGDEVFCPKCGESTTERRSKPTAKKCPSCGRTFNTERCLYCNHDSEDSPKLIGTLLRPKDDDLA